MVPLFLIWYPFRCAAVHGGSGTIQFTFRLFATLDKSLLTTAQTLLIYGTTGIIHSGTPSRSSVGWVWPPVCPSWGCPSPSEAVCPPELV